MYWIAKALEKDFGYTKGLVFREKMICECPHLRSDCQPLFNDWYVPEFVFEHLCHAFLIKKKKS